MTQTALLLLLGIFFCTTLSAQNQAPKLITWQDIASTPVPAPDFTISYGLDSLQFGELRLPKGKGPFPVVVVVHGGCWLSEYDLHYMAHVSEALTKAGYATWMPEFRRVGNEGGGWPGTFLDVAKATDFLRELAKKYPLDIKQVVTLGHSAGGHLALWLAARPNLPRTSELYTSRPLKLKGVVALAGITDLTTYSVEEGSCNAAVAQLLEGLPATQPGRYAQTSPLQLLPLRLPQYLVQGALDPIVPVSQAQHYAEQAQAKGDKAQVLLLPNAAHFDLVAPWSPVWPSIEQAVESLIGGKASKQ
ncbi:alpha/beta hydrolase family protein [Pontibacter ummariensis]|uniref:Alpha/beta hydrolase family protein n=1 Tax=Pontibacter ummariensis TaxID=1610492 RepID=A0A239I9S0_9BACT|nr:alpha/beta hydrolase [Pontibacter ummariensis]PRY09991.1 alpha/beta hydrolase family protein [Pontibacter ummariensis]SNS89793.1 Alpha/beta hydrolase family protein [Pontibacter ummariensis]